MVHGSSPCGPTIFESRALRGFCVFITLQIPRSGLQAGKAPNRFFQEISPSAQLLKTATVITARKSRMADVWS
ncbi:hypothetical protein EMIT0373P_40055 [Pseudomonas chlororaphis]